MPRPSRSAHVLRRPLRNPRWPDAGRSRTLLAARHPLQRSNCMAARQRRRAAGVLAGVAGDHLFGAHRHDLVAIKDSAPLVDHDETIGVAVQSQADIVIAGRAFSVHQLGLYSEALFVALIITGRFLPPLNEVALPAYAELAKG